MRRIDGSISLISCCVDMLICCCEAMLMGGREGVSECWVRCGSGSYAILDNENTVTFNGIAYIGRVLFELLSVIIDLRRSFVSCTRAGAFDALQPDEHASSTSTSALDTTSINPYFLFGHQ